jgi:hypothetical protein
MQKIEKILDICCYEFDVSIDEVRGKCRRRSVVACRRAFVHIVKNKYNLTHAEMSKYLCCTPQNVSAALDIKQNSCSFYEAVAAIENQISFK